MIVKRRNEYCLLTKDGSRTLGCHPTHALATKQEAAVMASKAEAKGSESRAFTGKDGRESAAVRGYDAAWRKTRAEFLAKHPICNYPKCKAPATEADHISAKPARLGGSDAWKSLQPRCSSHHSKKTASVDGGFGNPKRDREDKAAAAKGSEQFRAGQPRHPKSFHAKHAQTSHGRKGPRSPSKGKGKGKGGGGGAANQKEWEDGLSGAERSSIEDYTEEKYMDLNENMRNNVPLTSDQKVMSKNITSALDRAPPVPPPKEVYRGMKGEGAMNFAAQLKVGDSLGLKGFQSTSVDKDKSVFFSGTAGKGGVLMVIKPKSGGFIQNISTADFEKEFLMGHNKKFKVNNISTGATMVINLSEE